MTLLRRALGRYSTEQQDALLGTGLLFIIGVGCIAIVVIYLTIIGFGIWGFLSWLSRTL